MQVYGLTEEIEMITKYSEVVVVKVWQKGIIIPGYNPNEIRKDVCGALIKWSEYGNRDSKYGFGWEIDHIVPGGSDDIGNLRPLHWYNNCSRQDGRLNCPISAD